eukprot:TRINITY_DN229_c0_g1_i2.p1 TRINITY_DN229_c0_g1~~TRINITY_DN229_c0_g1_i2.p1  ORF type:complete len:189 (+),score=61.69 TRINITY_DN229_c0_g1_i2:122-688(+)
MSASRVRAVATYAGDMHAMEQHMLEAFERQLTLTKDHPDAYRVVELLISTCKRHISVLDAHVNSLGDVEKVVTDKLKTMMAGLFGVGAGIVDMVRPLAASKAMRDDYTAINHAIVGYVMLCTTSSAVGQADTLKISEEFLKDWINASQKVITVVPLLSVKDLQESGVEIVDFSAGQKWASFFSGEAAH